MKKTTLEEQIKCVIREIGLRKRVYPKFIETNRIKPEEAKYQIQTMEDVLDTLRQYEWHGNYNYQREFWEREKETRNNNETSNNTESI